MIYSKQISAFEMEINQDPISVKCEVDPLEIASRYELSWYTSKVVWDWYPLADLQICLLKRHQQVFNRKQSGLAISNYQFCVWKSVRLFVSQIVYK